MQREAWSDGEIAAMWPAALCEDMTQTLVLKHINDETL